MNNAKRTAGFIFIFFLLITVGCERTTRFERYIEIELQRVAELYHLLDNFSEQIWPGWTNYNDIEIELGFPSRIQIVINPQGELPEGYVLVEDRTVNGKSLYIDRSEEIPSHLSPPLTSGGGALYGRIVLKKEERHRHLSEMSRKEFDPVEHLDTHSEGQIFISVHELMHEHQTENWLPKKERAEKIKKRLAERRLKPKDKKQEPRKIKDIPKPPIFMMNMDYAVTKEIEGDCLLKAYQESDEEKALEYLKEAFTARKMRHSHMPETEVKLEIEPSVAEGTATYSQVKMAQLILDSRFPPLPGWKIDPYFFDFAYMEDYIRQNTTDKMASLCRETLNENHVRYYYGLFYCLLLDRFVPGWKKGFLEEGRTLDGEMEKLLAVDADEEEQIKKNIRRDYDLEELSTRHGAVIKERDDAISFMDARKGKKYVIDITDTKEFIRFNARGKSFEFGIRKMCFEGIEPFTMGEIELTSGNTPIDRNWIYSAEWIDTDAVEGEKGYSVECEHQEGDILYDAVVTTGGFTLKAPELIIIEDEDGVVFRILSKVNRTKIK